MDAAPKGAAPLTDYDQHLQAVEGFGYTSWAFTYHIPNWPSHAD